jgi:Na+/H+ antiporter NhaC
MNNNTYNTIIAYIIIMVYLFWAKPEFIYDHNEDQFKEFGIENNKTPLSIHVIAIILPIIIYVIFCNANNNQKKSVKKRHKQSSIVSTPSIQYIPVHMVTSNYSTESN